MSFALLSFWSLGCFAMDKINRVVHLEDSDLLFVREKVPLKGIVCSNADRARRIGQLLENTREIKSSWGPFVIIGKYKNQEIFIAGASVGTGSGLLFNELFTQGAKYIIRYGSDDVKTPPDSDANLVKIIDEADGLVGFEVQSGIPIEKAGQLIKASEVIISALLHEAAPRNNIIVERRICHHLENYHGLRASNRFIDERRQNLNSILKKFESNPKPASYDMETAVLFRVANDFGGHAATVLQTVSKAPNDSFGKDNRWLILEQEVYAPLYWGPY